MLLMGFMIKMGLMGFKIKMGGVWWWIVDGYGGDLVMVIWVNDGGGLVWVFAFGLTLVTFGSCCL